MASATSSFRLNILENAAFLKTARRKSDEGDTFRRREYFCCDGFSDSQLGAAPLPGLSRIELSVRLPVPRFAIGTPRLSLSSLREKRQHALASCQPRSKHALASFRRRKAVALVRMVDAHPEGRRSRVEPRPQLEKLGPAEWTARRRGRGLVPPCRHDHRTDRERTVDRQVRQ